MSMKHGHRHKHGHLSRYIINLKIKSYLKQQGLKIATKREEYVGLTQTGKLKH
jgi:hypothetical protein